jgi:hypothetical protein
VVWDKQQVQVDSNQVAELQARVADLEAQLKIAVGILGLMRPAETVLARCGADQAQQQALYRMIDEMEARVIQGSSVSYSDFSERVADLVPGKRGDRKFVELLIDALKLERPSSKPMLDYLTNAMALFRR